MISWPSLLAILVGVTLVASMAPGAAIITSIARGLWILARRDWLAFFIVAVVAFLAASLPSLIWSVPVPVVHDEFSYLLAGDTFARAGLTNPPLPDGVWPSFETFHVIQRPTYASKFPPGQGAALAIGQLPTGRPIVGVWLSYAAACAGVAWLLRGAMPMRWAMLGGLLVAIHPAVFWWSQTYWGGAVAMLGGALLCGAALRIARLQQRAGPSPGRAAWTNGAIAGIGVAILANSRPFEGLILTCLVGALLLAHAIARHRLRTLITGLLLAAALVLAPVAGWMAYYNWRVTGDPLTLPYTVHARQYMSAPLFFWQRPPEPPPTYLNPEFARFFRDIELPEFERARTISGRLASARILLGFTYPFTFLVPLIGLVITPPRRLTKLSIVGTLVALAAVLIEMLATPWMRIAYLAPLVGLLALAVTVAMRQVWRTSPRAGVAIVTAVLISQLAAIVPWAARLHAQNAASFGASRDRLIHMLHSEPGKQLVFVRYGPRHDPREQWVANGADLNAAQLIFARSLDEQSDRRVAEHFPNRRLWLLDINDPEPPRIQPLARP